VKIQQHSDKPTLEHIAETLTRGSRASFILCTFQKTKLFFDLFDTDPPSFA
jgi:hypothetical protein